jgi:hypothetical protein
MIPWYSVAYSSGLEHIFISWKFIGLGIVTVTVVAFLVGCVVKSFK